MQEIRQAFEIEKYKEIFGYQWNTSFTELTKNSDIKTIGFSRNLEMGKDGEIKIIFTDINHPFSIEDWIQTKKINIDEQYYYLHKKEVIFEIVNYIRKHSKDSFSIINPELVIDEIIEAIVENKNIKKVNLGSPLNQYSLNMNTYLKLKEAGITEINTQAVDNELIDTFDPIIKYNRTKKLIKSYTYEDLQNRNYIEIKEPLEQEEMENLKYLRKGIVIKIECYDFENIYEMMNRINSLGILTTFQFSIKNNKQKITDFFLKYYEEFQNYLIECQIRKDDKINMNEFINYEKRLYEMIKPAINLSPFEKYLYAYHKVKKYKKYLENQENPFEARDLYKILDGDYMVCGGFAILLGDLLEKLGIENIEYGISVDTTYDELKSNIDETPEDISVKHSGHARRIINIVDPKYNLNGIYISDPTWDNYMEEDTYCFALLTPDEVVTAKRYLLFDKVNATELLYVNSIEEFYSKINFIIDHKMLSTKDFSKDNYAQEITVIARIIEMLQKLDSKFYEQFIIKYPKFKLPISKNKINVSEIIKSNLYDKSEIQDMLLELGEYIVRKVNKPLDKTTLENGLIEMYHKGYEKTLEEAQELSNKAIEDTRKKVQFAFPQRYKIYPDDSQEIYDNETNKFHL